MNEKVDRTPRMLLILEDVAGLDQRRWFENVLAQEPRGLAGPPKDWVQPPKTLNRYVYIPASAFGVRTPRPSSKLKLGALC